MITIVDEEIKVMAIFGSSQTKTNAKTRPKPTDATIRPVKFRWRGVLYPVIRVTYRWQTQQGSSTVLHFSVSNNGGLYELTYNKSSLQWRLSQIDG
jgi:hypothetical protein